MCRKGESTSIAQKENTFYDNDDFEIESWHVVDFPKQSSFFVVAGIPRHPSVQISNEFVPL